MAQLPAPITLTMPRIARVGARTTPRRNATAGKPWVQSARLPRVDDNRLTEVEVRYSYLERLVEDLSQAFYEQQRLIDKLSTRLEHVESLLAETLEDPSQRLPHEKPPHY